MKNKFLVWTLALIMTISTSFAGTITGVDERIANNFKKDFAAAEDVQWEKGNSFVKATFRISGQVMFAYYAEEGNLLAVSRNITSTQLPLGLLTELKKNYNAPAFYIAADKSARYKRHKAHLRGLNLE